MGVVIGITGRNCAGKDTVAEVLEQNRFERYSLSDVLREELRRRGQAITRPTLIALGNELRAAEGPGTLAMRVRDMIKTDRCTLVSVRNPVEVERLREIPGFELWAIEAPVEVRFEREVRRGRESQPTTLEAFMALEDQENTADPNAQQLDATMRLADVVFHNDDTLAALAQMVMARIAHLQADVATGEHA